MPSQRFAAKLGDPRARPGHPDSIVTDWSVDPDDYGTFLCTVWDEWMARDFGRFHVNYFETSIAQALGYPSLTCVSSPICGKALAFEDDGALFSCDHFVYPDFQVGNITENHEGDMAFSQRQASFGMVKSDSLPSYCRSCDQLDLFLSERPKNHLIRTFQGEPGLNYLSAAPKRFCGRVRRDMPEIHRRLGIAPAHLPTRKRRRDHMRPKTLKTTLLGSVAGLLIASPLMAQDRSNILVITRRLCHGPPARERIQLSGTLDRSPAILRS